MDLKTVACDFCKRTFRVMKDKLYHFCSIHHRAEFFRKNPDLKDPEGDIYFRFNSPAISQGPEDKLDLRNGSEPHVPET